MGDIGSAIKYLYSQFILRDVLSFITPGAIVVLTAFLLFLPKPILGPGLEKLFIYSTSMHWLLYIPLFGGFYMVGFAVQCFGEIWDIIRFTPKGQGSWCQRFKIFWFKWADSGKNKEWWWHEDHKRFADFFEATEKNGGIRQGRERMVVLKQMCANGFLAISMAVFLLCISLFQLSLWLILIVAIPLLASLFWGYRVHVLRQNTRETIAIDRKKES